jgi:spore maturation protein SpmA
MLYDGYGLPCTYIGVFGLMGGRIGEVSAAAIEGANASLELCIGLLRCCLLWSGIME